jgi:glutamyl-tRNA synthetase
LKNSARDGKKGQRDEVRVRFAPSPTGYLHVGGARTALFNWLYARHHRGKFILRIEDTDKARSTPELTNMILDSLRWLGLDWDEGPEAEGEYGPYFQSERSELYRQALAKLQAEGKVYPCFCSAEELEERRQEQMKAGKPPRYDRRCRQLEKKEVERLIGTGKAPAWRLAMPTEGETAFDDLVRGKLTFANQELDDFILVRSDGSPTYNFVVVVDDINMHITQVIRGEDHISNTPKQIQVYNALGAALPEFGHIPLVLGKDKSRLSKRHGATSMDVYRDEGYLPEAMFNFLALLGWSSGTDRELFSRQELVELFDLSAVGKAGSVFDMDKLSWMNGYYIRQMDDERFLELTGEKLVQAGIEKGVVESEWGRKVALLEKEKMKSLDDVVPLTKFFFSDELLYEEKAQKQLAGSAELLRSLKEGLNKLERFDAPALEEFIRGLAEKRGESAGKLIHPLRAALSGLSSGPGLFEMMELLGKERCINRIEAALERFGGKNT